MINHVNAVILYSCLMSCKKRSWYLYQVRVCHFPSPCPSMNVHTHEQLFTGLNRCIFHSQINLQIPQLIVSQNSWSWKHLKGKIFLILSSSQCLGWHMTSPELFGKLLPNLTYTKKGKRSSILSTYISCQTVLLRRLQE